MNRQLRLIILGIGLIILIDSIGSIASHALNFNYSYFAILSILDYGLIGYLTTKYYNQSKALLAGLIMGLFDATIGWQIAVKLKANAEGVGQEMGIGGWIFMILYVLAFAMICSLLGGLIYKKTKKKESLPTTPHPTGN